MKREQILLSTMTDTQLGHTKRLIDREVSRRGTKPASRKTSRKAKK